MTLFLTLHVYHLFMCSIFCLFGIDSGTKEAGIDGVCIPYTTTALEQVASPKRGCTVRKALLVEGEASLGALYCLEGATPKYRRPMIIGAYIYKCSEISLISKIYLIVMSRNSMDFGWLPWQLANSWLYN